VFPLLLQTQDQSDYKEVVPLIVSHLESLTVSLDQYFLLCHQKCMTGLGTFCLVLTKFSGVPLDVLWIAIRKEYPVISSNAVKIFLQFSSYLCEQGLSCLTNIKSKDRNCLLSVEEELRVCLSKI
jgi:hypothetical protein